VVGGSGVEVPCRVLVMRCAAELDTHTFLVEEDLPMMVSQGLP
jgi:hypothetical protein